MRRGWDDRDTYTVKNDMFSYFDSQTIEMHLLRSISILKVVNYKEDIRAQTTKKTISFQGHSGIM